MSRSADRGVTPLSIHVGMRCGNVATSSPRIAILWSRWTGYMEACAGALGGRPGVELYVARRRNRDDTPFTEGFFGGVGRHRVFDDEPDAAVLMADLEAFEPNVLLVCSWHVRAYRRVARRFAGRATRVLFVDNQLLGTGRQRVGLVVAPFLFRPLFEHALVPGVRQHAFARRFGFPSERISLGGYSCDHQRFAGALVRDPVPRAFVFVGRLLPIKGLDLLLEAYAEYRRGAMEPWSLIVCGSGPLEGAVAAATGVRFERFVQPDALPAMMAQASCLVLPSRFEPWGLVVHEATSAGLGLICSTACGAADTFLRDGVNGCLVETGDGPALTTALQRFAAMADARMPEIRATSRELAATCTPQTWAQTVLGYASAVAGQRQMARPRAGNGDMIQSLDEVA